MLLVKGAFLFPPSQGFWPRSPGTILGLVWTAEADACLTGPPSWETPRRLVLEKPRGLPGTSPAFAEEGGDLPENTW